MPTSRKTRKVAISSSKRGGLDDKCNLVFEQCHTFTVVELEDGEVKNVEVVRNPGYQSGDCIGLIGILKRKGVDSILAGGMGRIAFKICNDLGIGVYLGLKTVKVRASLESYLDNDFIPLTSAMVCNTILEKWSMW